MTDDFLPQPVDDVAPRRSTWVAATILIIAGAAAYGNAGRAGFVYDDVFSIVDNQTIRHLWPLTGPLQPPQTGLPVDGRPLVNLSLALNYAWGGVSPTGYHLLNVVIHLLATLALFGCVRRTLAKEPWRDHFGNASVFVAAAAAGWWMLHPLQTESVTYVAQRAESLMGLFYLVTFYCSIRAMERPTSRGWSGLAVLACVSGMATKEVMVSAPLLVWCYDAVFVAGTFGGALRARRALYLGLAASWLVLGWLVLHAGNRGGSAGLDAPMSASSYALTQFNAVVRYVWLAVWPHPLVFDYGIVVATRTAEIWASATIVSVAAATTAIGLYRRHWFGFLGAWFFAILAPSSSVVPIATETIAEHRMYLPLAAVVVAGVVTLWRAIAWPSLGLACLVCGASLGITFDRNRDYHSEETLWRDTAAKRPENARAHFNLGVALFLQAKPGDAIREYREAIRLRPDFASAHSKLARVLFDQGELNPAKEHAEQALRLNPRLGEAHANLGGILFRESRVAEALTHYEEAARLLPDDADIRNNLGTALSALGRLDDAVREYEAAVRVRPAFAVGRFHLGNTLARLGRFAAAAEQYEAALRIQPDYKAAQDNLARVRALERRTVTPPRN